VKPAMVMRSHRYPEPLYEAAMAKAEERGESLSDVLREALERYVKRR
jgi:predicted HicB family RNase H-like nuclease